MPHEAIILIPGVSSPGTYTEELIANLTLLVDTEGRGTISSETSDGLTRYTFTPPGQPATQCVVREVAWSDLPYKLSTMSGLNKAWSGLGLLTFVAGLTLRHGRVFFHNKYQAVVFIFSATILYFWYLSVLVVVPPLLLEALGIGNLATGGESTLLEKWKALGIDALPFFAVLTAIMAAVRVNALVDTSSAIKQYLTDEADASNRQMGEEVRARIAREISALQKPPAEGGPAYSRVTILAYSFGAIPAVEALSRYRRGAPLIEGAEVRLVTLGAPLPVAAAGRSAVGKAVETLLADGRISCWLCFWSPYDWLCGDPRQIAAATEALGSTKIQPIERQGTPIWSGPAARHQGYFSDDALAAFLLGMPLGPTPVAQESLGQSVPA